MQYIKSTRVIHLAQDVQKENHPKVCTRQLQITHKRAAQKIKKNRQKLQH